MSMNEASNVVISSCPSSPTDDDEHAFDYLVVIDFEATCDDGVSPTISLSRNNQEMIEFPFVLVRLKDPSEIDPNDTNPQFVQIVHQEQHFVRPEYSAKLTPFCTELTGITDSTLEKYGKPLKEVVSIFDNFVEQQLKDKRFCILTDGEWDIKQLLIRESKNKQIPLMSHYYSFFDMKKEYRKCFPDAYVRGLLSMVEHSGIKFVGRHHSGIDDCLTIVQLVNVLLQNGHKFKDPCVIDERYDPFRDSSFVNFRQSPPKQVATHYMPVYNDSYYVPQQSYYNSYYSYGSYIPPKQKKRSKPLHASNKRKGKRSFYHQMAPSGISISERQQ